MNNKGFLKYDIEKLKEGRKDFLNMYGSEECLTEGFVDFIVMEVLQNIGYDIPELRQAILNKFPQYNEGIFPFSEAWASLDNRLYVKLIAKPGFYYDEGTEVFNYEGKRFTLTEWKEWQESGICTVRGLHEGKWDGECSTCDEFEVEQFVEYKEIENE